MQKIILSIHGWEITPIKLINIIEYLFSLGYVGLSLQDLIKDQSSNKSFAVTTDDGDLGDISFAEILSEFGIELCSFINSSTINEESLNRFKSTPNINLQDHGLNHLAIATSPVFKGITSKPLPIEGFSSLKCNPILDRTGYLASPGFIIDRNAIEIWNEIIIDETLTDEQIIDCCLKKGILITKGKNHIQFKGSFETISQYKKRVERYVDNGYEIFNSRVGKRPQFFAYTWWLGTSYCDRLLKNKGYTNSFRNRGLVTLNNNFDLPRLFLGNENPDSSNKDLLSNTNTSMKYDFEFWHTMKYTLKKLLS